MVVRALDEHGWRCAGCGGPARQAGAGAGVVGGRSRHRCRESIRRLGAPRAAVGRRTRRRSAGQPGDRSAGWLSEFRRSGRFRVRRKHGTHRERTPTVPSLTANRLSRAYRWTYGRRYGRYHRHTSRKGPVQQTEEVPVQRSSSPPGGWPSWSPSALRDEQPVPVTGSQEGGSYCRESAEEPVRRGSASAHQRCARAIHLAATDS